MFEQRNIKKPPAARLKPLTESFYKNTLNIFISFYYIFINSKQNTKFFIADTIFIVCFFIIS